MLEGWNGMGWDGWHFLCPIAFLPVLSFCCFGRALKCLVAQGGRIEPQTKPVIPATKKNSSCMTSRSQIDNRSFSTVYTYIYI